jgi:hypothetical protein
LFLLLVGATLWLVIVVLHKKEAYRDNPILLNFTSSLNGGRFLGSVISSQIVKNKRHFLTMAPYDIDLSKKEKIEDVNIIVDSGKLVSLPKGHPSKDKNFLIALPPKAEELSPIIKDTLVGKGIMFMTELDNLAKNQTDILREGIERRDALSKEYGTGEMSVKFLQFTQALVQDYMESVLIKSEKGKSSFPINPNVNQNMP